MIANSVQMGAGWLVWMAWITPSAALLAMLAFVLRRWRTRAAGPVTQQGPDTRTQRFEEAIHRPRKRRMAVLDTPVSQVPATLLKIGAAAAAAATAAATHRHVRPGLTNRWKGEHRIVLPTNIHRR